MRKRSANLLRSLARWYRFGPLTRPESCDGRSGWASHAAETSDAAHRSHRAWTWTANTVCFARRCASGLRRTAELGQDSRCGDEERDRDIGWTWPCSLAGLVT